MPYSDDKEHFPNKSYYPGKTNDQIYIRLNVLAAKSVFWPFSQSHNKLQSRQSHIINLLLILFARSLKERIAFGFIAQTSLLRHSISIKILGQSRHHFLLIMRKSVTISIKHRSIKRRSMHVDGCHIELHKTRIQ